MRNIQDKYGFTNAFGFDLGFEKSNEEVVEIADQSKQKLQGFMKEFLFELNSDN